MSPRLPDPGTDAAAIRDSLTRPRAFGLIFDRHFGAIHGYAARRVGTDLAEEISAETFTRAFDARRRYDLRRPDARPWLLGIAANLLRRQWRSERRRIAAYARAGPGPAAAPDHSAGELAAALDTLAQRDREALFLFVWADLSYEEIGMALEIPVGTVRSRIARSRRVLRHRLEPSRHDPTVHPRLVKESPTD